MGLLDKGKYVTYVLIPGSYALTILYDKFGNVIAETKTDLKEDIVNEAENLLNEAFLAGAELVDDIKDVSVEVANASLDVIEGAGLAVLSAGELMYDYTYSKLAPYRVETVTAVTAMLIYSITALTIFKKIRAN